MEIIFDNGFILNESRYKKMVFDILAMTHIAKSGHPGGSLSTLPLIIAAYSKITDIKDSYPIVISNGHVSPALYTVLSNAFNIYTEKELYELFRNFELEGHVTRDIDKGIWWSTGSLGQGLSAACAFAYYEKYINKSDNTVICIMGDGECQKGQVNESYRFIKSYNLDNLKILIDYNGKQITGDLKTPLSIPFKDSKTISIRNDNIIEYIDKVINFIFNENEYNIAFCKIPMGYPISFMLNEYKYHGKPLNDKEMDKAIIELFGTDDKYIYSNKLCHYIHNRSELCEYNNLKNDKSETEYFINLYYDNYPDIEEYDIRTMLNDRLIYFCEKYQDKNIIFNDCDLAGSVGFKSLDKLQYELENIHFIEHGIMEHHTATFSGALSTYRDNIVIWSDFGVFGLDEVYNQLRMINLTPDTKLKLILTHNGINVGEDGKTHQCIDYINLIYNLTNFRTFIPVDAYDLRENIDKVLLNKCNMIIILPRSQKFVLPPCKSLLNPDISIAFIGSMGEIAYKVSNILKEEYDILNRIIPIRSINPINLDSESYNIISDSKMVFLITDHLTNNLAKLQLMNLNNNVYSLGLNNYSKSANYEDLLKHEKLDVDNVLNFILKSYVYELKKNNKND